MARPGISTKNTEKMPPGLKFWTPGIYPQNTPKIRKNTPKIQKMPVFGIFSGYFRGIFGVFSLGFRISARGVFFRYFSWKFRVGPFRGSVASRGVLKANYGGKIEHKLYFSNFSGTPGISQQNPGISCQKKFGFPGFEGHTELFGPHPFMWKTPTSQKIPGPKSLSLCSFFLLETNSKIM